MTPAERSIKALALLSIDPAGLGGVILRARHSPTRTAFLENLSCFEGPVVKLFPNMSRETLDGGLDITSTLQSGKMVSKQGLLEHKNTVFLLISAERTDPLMVASLNRMLDQTDGNSLIALDEGVDEDETAAPALSERLALHISLDDLRTSDLISIVPDSAAAKARLADVSLPEDAVAQVTVLAKNLGIPSLRAPTLMLKTARAHAALCGKEKVGTEDLEIAAELVFAHRATRLPEVREEKPQPEPEQDGNPAEDQVQTNEMDIPEDILLEAVKAALPAGLLSGLSAKSVRGAKGSGSGHRRVGNRRGRPLPSRNGHRAAGARIDLVATLRAAVPWQTIRKKAFPDRQGPIIRPSDLHFKRFEDHSDRLLIFTVDASGSAAFARLSEAKGAVEYLLSEAYARRDHVALISFRGTGAEVLLPPTRSLVQTKRRLADLPGGGGTPLAAGLSEALQMALQTHKRGLTPIIVLLTDGRSNIALDGSAARVQAASDVEQTGQIISMNSIEAIVIDTGKRPERGLKLLANTLRAPYIALPRADAKSLSESVSTALKA